MRSATVDWLKASAICAVVATHSGPALFAPAPTAEYRLRVVLSGFHVPTFLMMSGYLLATTAPLPWSVLGRRLTKVLVPYTVATLIWTALGYGTWARLPQRLLLGDGLGIYYFVFLWTWALVTSWLWSRLTARACVIALVLATVLSLLRHVISPPTGLWWAIRDPVGQGTIAYFLFGWCARLRSWDRMGPTSGILALGCCLPWLLFHREPAFPTSMDVVANLALRMAYAVGVAWLVTAWMRIQPPRVVVWLSMATLPIYLYHAPLAALLASRLVNWPPLTRTAMVWSISLGATAGAVVLAQHVLPARYRPWLLGA